MNYYKQFVDTATMVALEELSNSEIGDLMSPWADIDYGYSKILVQNISIRIAPRKFVVIKNDWSDTPKEAHDYYYFEAKIIDQPLDIRTKDEGYEHYTYFGDHTTLRLGAKAQVKSVSILSDKYVGDVEAVEYDAGILIELENGKMVSIVRQESISGFLEVSHTDAADEVRHLSVRVKL